jgi:hypothetical protein
VIAAGLLSVEKEMGLTVTTGARKRLSLYTTLNPGVLMVLLALFAMVTSAEESPNGTCEF